MSTLSLRKIKHDGSAVDNIVTNTDGGVGIGGIDPSTLPSFVHHAVKVQNGGGLGIQSDSATDNRWIFFGNGTTSGDVQRAGIVNQGSDQSLALATAGTQRLIVDASGRVTIPGQVFFFATNTAQAGDGITSSPFQFNNVVHNRGGGYNNSTHAFTAPVAGVYIFNANAGYKQSGTTFIIRWQVNNTDVTDGIRLIGGYPDSHSGSQITYLRYLSAGDSVRLNPDSSTYHRNNSNVPNYFSGYLLG